MESADTMDCSMAQLTVEEKADNESITAEVASVQNRKASCPSHGYKEADSISVGLLTCVSNGGSVCLLGFPQ